MSAVSGRSQRIFGRVTGYVIRRAFGRIVLRAPGVALAGVLTLGACAATYQNHGYVPTDEDLAQVQVGTDTRETVAQAIGTPTTEGILAETGWYYVQSRYENYLYHEPQEIDRQVVAISFDKRGVVENVERFGLEQGRVVALSRRVTKPTIKGITFLQQLFRSFGRMRAGDLMN